MIYYSSPYYHNRIGKAYNSFCEIVPNDDDWICLTDGDMMFLDPHYGTFISQIIEDTDFALIGCMTNRVRAKRLCHGGQISTDFDISNHYKIAKERKEKYGTLIEQSQGIAGYFMLFQKKTWQRAGGFGENGIVIDANFNKAVRKFGKIGVAKGLYVFHSYRLWAKDAVNSREHLKIA